MTWTIDPTVSINGTNYTSDTLNGVSINYGRADIWEQARAGYATIQIINTTDAALSIALNDSVVIQVDDSSGTPVTLFTGKVQAVSNTIQYLGSIGKALIHNVTAIAPFADMARVITHTSGFPKEYDDDRLDRILTASGVTIDVVDTPGVYEFTASQASPGDCYYWASYYANMAFGYIYETTDGKVGYANESRRTVDAGLYGYTVIPGSTILWPSVNSEINLNNLLNDLRLEYKANASVTSTSASSIATYGKQAADLKTELEDATEAQLQADRYISLRSTPRTLLPNFTIQLDAPTMTNGLLDDLLAMYMGFPIEVNHFPLGIYSGDFQGFVEGWNFTISRNTATLNLNVTEKNLSLAPTRWQDVSPALIWSAVNAALEWAEYE